jgi:hypothetical protein
MTIRATPIRGKTSAGFVQPLLGKHVALTGLSGQNIGCFGLILNLHHVRSA